MSEKKQVNPHARKIEKKRTRTTMEVLENRTLFSADVFGAFLDAPSNDDHYQTLVDTTSDSPMLHGLPADDSAVHVPAVNNDAAKPADVHELVVIDGRTPDSDRIVGDILAQAEAGRHIEIVTLDPTLDGLSQLNALFARYHGLDTVHVISHGSDGALQLGNGVLTLDTLQENATNVRAWAGAFSENGDFLIYGCNLAASNQGQHFIDALGQLTGTDVAASDNLTGSARLGGDWILEYSSGHIESSLAVSLDLQHSYDAVLVNSAPVLSGANNFTSINEDNTNSSGTLVSSLLAGHVSDVDGGAQGIAVIAVDNSNGTWQYTTDGSTWTNIPAVSQTSAGLLAADADNAVRFVPNANYNGTVTNGITFYAWDQSVGSDATLVSTIRTDTVLDNFSVQSYSNNYGNQNWSSNWIEVGDGSGATGGDFSVQSGQLRLNATNTSDYIYRQANLSGAQSATLSFNYVNNLDNFWFGDKAIQVQVSGNGGASWSTLDTFNESNNGSGSRSYDISAFIASNTTLRFKTSVSDSSSNYLYIDNVQIAYDVKNIGGSAPFSSASASASITVNSVNDVPVNTLPVSKTLNEDTSTALTGISITDVDGNVTAAQLGVSQGKLTVSLAGGATISAGANNSSTLTLAGTQTQINAALSTLSYLGNLNYYGADTLTLTSTDSSAASDSDSMSITVANVNDPISITSSATVSVAENQNSAYTITVFNPDPAETVTYSIDSSGVASSYEDNAKVSVNASTGAVTFLTVPNFESPADATPDHVYHIKVKASDNNGYTASIAVAVTITNANDAPTGTVSISGTATENQLLTASNTLADQDGLGAVNYQWLRNGVDITGATASTYSLGDADVGKNISVRASYTDGGGFANAVTSTATAAVLNVNDVPAGLPAITGTATEDQSLSVNTAGISDADGLGAFSYQWLRNGSAVTGATGSSYTLGDADVANNISVRVTYTDGQGTSESLTSAATAAVVNVNDTPVGLPVISGTASRTETLTANTSGISDADGLGVFSYQWLSNGGAISGATAATYVLDVTDVGNQISVEVSYTDAHGTLETLTSTQTAAVTSINTAPAGLLAITGTATENQMLTADTSGISDADGLGAFSYQWLRNGSAIGGATSGTYTLGNADVGSLISVRVSYTDGGNTSEVLTSAATAAVANVNDTPVGLPSIVGTATENQTLTADTSGISDADGLGAFSYQWLRNGSAIGGATASTYTLGNADVGTQISVQVSYTDGHGTSEGPLTSSATTAITNVNDVPVGLPAITGTATQNQTLTADTSGISDADGLGAPSYQWLRDGVAIGGATSSTYILDNADVGTQISVQVTYTDGHGTSEGPLTSVLTTAVVNVNDAPTLITLSNTVVDENTDTSAGYSMGGLVTSDVDVGDTATYSIVGGADAALFSMGDDSVNEALFSLGLVRANELILRNGILNFENQASYIVIVRSTDAGASTHDQTFTITVNNINEAPVNTVAGPQTVAEDTALALSGLSVNDVDGNLSSVQLSVGQGNLNVSLSGAASISAGANSSGSLTLTGSQTDLNATLATLSYQGNLNFNGSDTLTILSTDSAGVPLSDSDTVVITVSAVNDAPVGLPAITGTTTENQTLTADTSGISDADGLGAFSYQWLRNGTAITGATSGTYTLGNADVGCVISVQVSYTDGHGTSEGPLISSATGAVINVNDAPVGLPAITGIATENQMLTADTSGISDADGLGAFSYQWLRNGTAITGATSGTYTLGNADVGCVISVQVSYTDGHGTSEGPLISSATGAVINVNDAPVGLPVITGIATENQLLTADTSGISDADGLGAFSYQWLRNGTAITGATSGTYTLGNADVGCVISVQVSYTDGHGTSEGPLISSATGAVINVNDVPVGLPAITGTTTENQLLTADTSGISDADGLGAFSYQWLRNGSAISGATGSTYTLGNADVGTLISVQVSYTDGHGTSEGPLISSATGAVINVNDAPVGLPAITGTTTENQLLTADTSGISDADGLGAFSYQWLRNGTAITGATSGTYTLGNADVGCVISVQVSYTDGHGTSEGPLTSSATTAVINVNDVPVGLPAITGTTTENQLLTADTSGISDADGLGAFSYQWLRNGSAISGATGSTYTLGNADVGTLISVQVSYTDGHGTSEGPLISSATGAVINVNDAPVGLPAITGTTTENQTLTADTSSISDADGLGAFSYQWLRNGTAITGATSGTYTLGNADVGCVISVQVSYTDGHGTSEGPLTSSATTAVINVNDAPVGLPAITGTTTENQLLTADTSGISDADGLGAFSYQWLRNGSAISGATASTYTLGNADVGCVISVQVSYTDNHGTLETLVSVPSTAVGNVNDAPTGSVSINNGAPMQGDLLSASHTLADADGLGVVSYQWLRNGSAIGGATAATYTTVQADVGSTLSVVASYTDGHGTLESVSSAATAAVLNVNDAPVFSGVGTGTVTKNVLSDGSTLLQTVGRLNISDPDSGESAFQAANITGLYGQLSINAAGDWVYQADNSQSAIQQLTELQTLRDVVVVHAVDGSSYSIVLTIQGSTLIPVTVTTPVSAPSEPVVTDLQTNLMTNSTTPTDKILGAMGAGAQASNKLEELLSAGRNTALSATLGNDVIVVSASSSFLRGESDAAMAVEKMLHPFNKDALSETKFIQLNRMDINWFNDNATLTTVPVQTVLSNNAFVNEMNQLQKDLDDVVKESGHDGKLIAEVSTGLSISLTAGLVSWMLRGGSLLASMMSVAPFWKQLDPLPILNSDAIDKKNARKDDKDGDEKDQRVEKIFDEDDS